MVADRRRGVAGGQQVPEAGAGLLPDPFEDLHDRQEAELFVDLGQARSGVLEGRAGGRPEFYLRQLQGSANYRTGGFINDLLHGWLNYQVEHHLFPDLSLLGQEKAAPRVREICERHGVQYIQESVWTRLRKTVAVMTGDASMKRA